MGSRPLPYTIVESILHLIQQKVHNLCICSSYSGYDFINQHIQNLPQNSY